MIYERSGVDRLAVDNRRAPAPLASVPLAVEHQRHVVDRAKQQAARKPTEPPVDGLPVQEVLG